MENPTPEMNLVLQIIYESQIKGKTVMSWSTRNKKLFLTFEFYHNVQCIEYISRRYINNITSYTFCLFLKSSNTFSVSLNLKIAAQYQLVDELGHMFACWVGDAFHRPVNANQNVSQKRLCDVISVTLNMFWRLHQKLKIC